ncbi:MAG TPA: glycosyltransferase family 39 protein, partial [Mesorhizobium sp.]|nr:glycosyltransferase family 39 protein [Mesorhizobium sp.]
MSAQPVWRLPPAAWQVRLMGATARLWPLAVLLAGALLYLPLLGLRPLRFEEGRRALQVMEMLDGGAWWRLKVLGEAYVNKPPFTPWLMAAAAFARGTLDETAVRLPSVLMALAGALSAGLAASRLAAAGRRVAGLAGGLAFLCGFQILLKARIGETDVTATALCGLAFAAWLDGRLRGGIGPVHWLLVTVFLACAALTKGLAGQEIAEIGLLGQAGAIAFSNGSQSLRSSQIMRRAMTYARDFDALVMHYAEDRDMARA